MKQKCFSLILLCLTAVLLLSACSSQKPFRDSDKTFAGLRPDDMEDAVEYKYFFLPKPYGPMPGFVGDPMPYCEDGTCYIYFLKEGAGRAAPASGWSRCGSMGLTHFWKLVRVNLLFLLFSV